jgi:hypothetical protein
MLGKKNKVAPMVDTTETKESSPRQNKSLFVEENLSPVKTTENLSPRKGVSVEEQNLEGNLSPPKDLSTDNLSPLKGVSTENLFPLKTVAVDDFSSIKPTERSSHSIARLKVLGVTEEEMKRWSALKKMGLTNDEFELGAKYAQETCLIQDGELNATKTDKLTGYTPTQRRRSKAVKTLGISEEEIIETRSKVLGSIGQSEFERRHAAVQVPVPALADVTRTDPDLKKPRPASVKRWASSVN